MDATTAQKIAMRDRILTSRRRRGLVEVQQAAEAIAAHLLAHEPVRRAATVAAYVSIGTEPGTGPLLEALEAGGRRVLLPVLLPDNDLDWGVHTGTLVPAARGMLHPSGPAIGLDAVAQADVVLVPALAVDRSGVRLGRGGGSYDRALARVPRGTRVLAVLYDDEVVDVVPAAGHDRRVTDAVTPAGIIRLRPDAT